MPNNLLAVGMGLLSNRIIAFKSLRNSYKARLGRVFGDCAEVLVKYAT